MVWFGSSGWSNRTTSSPPDVPGLTVAHSEPDSSKSKYVTLQYILVHLVHLPGIKLKYSADKKRGAHKATTIYQLI